MCLLSFYPPGIEPNAEHLSNGAAINQDGYGWCVATHDKLIIYRGLVAEPAIERFVQVRKRHLDMPAMFHSRWGTSGVESTFNCHPFLFGSDHRTAIAHNGILFSNNDPRDPRCDTRIFAETIMPRLYHRFDKPTAVEALEKHIGRSNKIVAITINPRYRANAYIFNENEGVRAGDGSWQSNYDYLGRVHTYTYSRTTWPDPDGSEIEYTRGGYWKRAKDSNTWTWHPWAVEDSDYASSTVKSVTSSLSINRTRFYGNCRHCGATDAVNYRLGRCMVCYGCTRCGTYTTPCECGWGESVDESEWESWLQASSTGQKWLDESEMSDAELYRALMAGDLPTQPPSRSVKQSNHQS